MVHKCIEGGQDFGIPQSSFNTELIVLQKKYIKKGCEIQKQGLGSSFYFI